MPNFETDNDGFIIVRRRSKRRANLKKTDPNGTRVEEVNDYIVTEKVLRRIKSIRNQLRNSSYFENFLTSLENALTDLGTDEVKQLICYGLGNFGISEPSIHQLSLLLELKRKFNFPTLLFDPIFTEKEKSILTNFDCILISDNEIGDRKVREITLFFLPHCEPLLANNILYANWDGFNLNNCVIFGNSFNRIIKLLGEKQSVKTVPYINLLEPFTTEIVFINDYFYIKAFSDLSLHYFPLLKILQIPKLLEEKPFPKINPEND